MIKKLTVLTLNAGLLDVEVFGRHILQPAPFVEERLAALPEALIKTGADVIALQEVYEQPHRQFLIDKLRKVYPHHFYSRQQRIFRLDNSLIYFSKYPIVEREIFAYKHSVFEEKLVVFKGVLIAKIDVADWGFVTFYNFHTVSSGVRDPQGESVEKARGEEIFEMIRRIEADRDRDLKIVLGDLNAGPETGRENYDMFSEFNYVDAIIRKNGPSFSQVTWDPKNRLNIEGPHNYTSPQRCDHIFLRNEDMKRIKIDRAQIVLTKPIVKLPSGEKVNVSDHSGVLVTLFKV